ncbi:branched-chain amino acid transport system substrate-binding protein [Antricoccus suffuscus]|uniref:Branched-chain amino acid transport system substrate-binding protein n=1 Tax=Antricoccus suffuscus TaxID=1629062 RepID=A0A2T1A1W0_9ACTN|nr:ABC transporter substrate-binding protein [Antricoccus suffuscus]PRZ42318.1 branched-chain amino acid transport system substrate-binding protein [Antricoccus suffuscus]
MRSRLFVGAVACVLCASACGGVATGSKTSSSSTDCGNQVKIGAPYPLSGDWAENGQNSLQGMEIAAAAINADGGIKNLKGAKIDIVSADTSSDNPAQAKTVTTNMLQGGDIAAIVGSYLSSLTLTTVVATESAHVPLITQSYVDELTQKGYKYVFQIAPKASAFGATTIKALQGLYKNAGKPLKSIVIVGGDDASNKAQADAVGTSAKTAGLTVADTVVFPDGLTDAQPIVGKIVAAKADAIVLGGNLPDMSLIIKGVRAQGVNTPIAAPGGGGGLTPQFAPTLGALSDGVMDLAAWNEDLQLPGVKEASAAYNKQYKQFMPQEAGESWAAVYEIAQVMNDKKTCDPQKIADGLRTTEFTSGPASAIPPGKVAYDKSGANKYITPVMVQWQSGDLKTIYPEKLATAKPILD